MSSFILDREKEKAVARLRKEYPDGMPRCGADALRLTLVLYTEQGRTINLDVQRVVANTRFCNKLWNASRFVCDAIESLPQAAGIFDSGNSELPRRAPMSAWILAQLDACAQQVNDDLDAYRLAPAATRLVRFFLNDFCDVYIEASKRALQSEQDWLVICFFLSRAKVSFRTRHLINALFALVSETMQFLLCQFVSKHGCV